MGFGTALHYVGTFMLLVATVLMVVASIGPPAVNALNLLNVNFHGANGAANRLYFGAFGYCWGGEGGCSSPRIGYSPGALVDGIDGIDIGRAAERTMRGLTHAFILHPIAGAVSFVAFLLSLKTGFLNLVTTIIAVLAFILAIINLAIDFSCFVIVRHDVNDDADRASARFGAPPSGSLSVLPSPTSSALSSSSSLAALAAARRGTRTARSTTATKGQLLPLPRGSLASPE